MTDHPLPDDELLSSFLDGELTAEEAARLDARLQAEPALAERLDALRAAAALAATPVTPLSSEDANRMIAAALAASSTAGNVTDLAAASERRKVWPARLATVAAGVIALAIAVPALQAIDSDNDSNDAGTADTAGADFDDESSDDGDDSTEAYVATEAAPLGSSDDDIADSDAAGEMETDEVSDDSLGGNNVPEAQLDPRVNALFAVTASYTAEGGFDPLPADLGEFDTTEDLSVALSIDWTLFQADAVPPSTTTAPATSFESDPPEAEVIGRALKRLDEVGLGGCDAILETLVESFGDDPILAVDFATATVAGDLVTVGLFEMPDGRATIAVIDQVTCIVLSDIVLDDIVS